jgi:hypothetical protein
VITIEQLEARLWEFDMLDEALAQVASAFEAEPMWKDRASLPVEYQPAFHRTGEALARYYRGSERMRSSTAKTKNLISNLSADNEVAQLILSSALESLEDVISNYQPMSQGLTAFLNQMRCERGLGPYVFVARE